MAFLRRGIGDNDSAIRSDRRSSGSSGFVRWFAVPFAVAGLGCWGMATLAGLHSAASLAYAGSFSPSVLPLQSRIASETALQPAKPQIVPVAIDRKLARLDQFPTRLAQAGQPVAQTAVDPFGKIIAEAKLSREKLHAAFARAGMAVSTAGQTVEIASVMPVLARPALAMPVAERFHRPADEAAPGRLVPQPTLAAADAAPASLLANGTEIQLAYASVDASADDTMQLALASLGDDPFGAQAGSNGEVMPESVEPPPGKPQAAPSKPDKPDAETRKPARSAKPEPEARPEPPQQLAYARPDKPAVGAFKNLFNTPKAGKGVAIYDISAAVVHMPDGTKLEAHSGIGKMADNPRYVHVKMNGPTPPNTYRLSMREKRFHGVEAVRMTPVGDQTMHGRDGILAHSYLLRGGRAESHGCVAFKDYQRFLKAFKQGKVTHIVVVPSMSKMPKVRLASMGRGA